MQNFLINATPASGPVQQPASTNGNSARPSEPFGEVLARQRANTDSTGAEAHDGKRIAAPADENHIAPDVEQTTELPALATDPASQLGNGLLATLASAASAPGEITGGEKPVRRGPEPDDTRAVPDNTLASLASPYVALLGNGSAMPSQAVAAGRHHHDPLQPSNIQPATVAKEGSLSSAPENTGKGQDKVAQFEAQAIEFSANGSAKAAQFDAKATVLAAKDNPGAAQFEAKAAGFAEKGETKAAQFEAKAIEFGAGDAAKTQSFEASATQPDAASNLSALAQPPNASIAAAQNKPVQTGVNTPVSHSAWGDEFSQKITWLASQHSQSAELHLNPPQLGPLDVVIKVSGDQATALFTSPHAAVRDAIEGALPKLREMLADNGIMLGNATVSDQSSREHRTWLADKQTGRNDDSSASMDRASSEPLSAIATPTARRHQGMVDTFV